MYFCYQQELKNIRAITFDSPGSLRAIENLKPTIVNNSNSIDIHNFDIITYLAEPNLVNTADRHIGKVFSFTETTNNQLVNNEALKSWLEKNAV